jgi:nitrous oxidase accessory protein NosD
MRLLALLLLSSLSLPAQEAPPLQDWIQEAIQAGGGVVTVPDGVHTLAEPLVIENAKKLALRGMGREGCVLRLAKPGPAVIEIRGDCEAVELAGLTLQGGGIRIEGGRDIQVRDSLFEGSGGPGVEFLKATESGVQRCSLRDGSGPALRAGGGATKIELRGNQITRCRIGIELDQARECLVTGNEIHGGETAVRVLGSAETHRMSDNGFHDIRGEPVVQRLSPTGRDKP